MTIDTKGLRDHLAAADRVFGDPGRADRMTMTAAGCPFTFGDLRALLDVYDAACIARDLSLRLGATRPHEERERYLDLHEKWIAATDAVDAAVDKAGGK